MISKRQLDRHSLSTITCRLIAVYITCCLILVSGSEALAGWNTKVVYNIPKTLRKTPIPMELIRGLHPVVKVLINDTKKAHMLVDTGATLTYLPASWLGIKPRRWRWIDSLCFENQACLKKIPVMADDNNYTLSEDSTYNGLIGMDILSQTGLTLDYKNRILYLDPMPTLHDPNRAITIPIMYNDKDDRPFAFVAIEGTGIFDHPTLLDTGASYCRITPRILDKLRLSTRFIRKEYAFSLRKKTMTEIHQIGFYCVGSACREEQI